MNDQAQDPLIGQVLDGRYAITRRLGTGGMGAVYEARQQRLGRDVAIKTIHAHLASKAIVIERFRREAMAAASAGSPHIVDVYDLGVMPGGAPYMVMELIAGADLRTHVETHGRLAATTAAHVIRQACDALEAAHEVGIVHRDVKPENIMITQRRSDAHYVKVVDFGISKLRDSSLTGSHELLGTPYSMAPEQLRGAGHVDARCDIYGLGVCLYWALSGEMPYEAESLPLLISKIASGQGIPLRARVRDLPPVAYDLVDTAMAREPDARFRTMAAFATALRTLENASPGAALAPTARPMVAPKPPPHPREPSTPPKPQKPKPSTPQPLVESKRRVPIHEPKTHATMLDGARHVAAPDTTHITDRLPTTMGSKIFRALVTLALLGGLGAGAYFGYEAWRLRTSPEPSADAGVAAIDAAEMHVGTGEPSAIPSTPTVPTPAAATIDVRGLRGADVRAGDRSCTSPCALTLPPGERRVHIGYSGHALSVTLASGETSLVALGAARLELEADETAIIGPHECAGACTVPLEAGHYDARGTYPNGAWRSPTTIRTGEVVEVRPLRFARGMVGDDTARMRDPTTSSMTPAMSTGSLVIGGHALRVQIDGRTCVPPCRLQLPAGPHQLIASFANGASEARRIEITEGQTSRIVLRQPSSTGHEDVLNQIFGTMRGRVTTE